MVGHSNIFGLGDVVDLPIQASLTANQHQIRCITQNALNYLEAKTMTGKYKMQTGLPIYTGMATMNKYFSENGVESLPADNLVKDTLTYYMFGKFGLKGQSKMYIGKNSGISKVYELRNKFEKGESTGAEPRFVMEH